MAEFWETAFKDKQEMWGLEPTQSSIISRDLFVANEVKSVLIPGMGYGRNAQIFKESGMRVAGIEISQTAIDLGKKRFGDELTFYHGSVTDMPFDDQVYDGVFCYGLIYLLDEQERVKLIKDCYNQLADNGIMVFTAITKVAKSYGQGIQIGKDRFEQFGGVKIFFYDKDGIEKDFGPYGLFEISEVEENQPFYVIKCRKLSGLTE
ncbi:MAG: class I SAM-dependent methyltransferase [Cytophagales bacterium]|nr:class I SAM-dependent methyltransferase [Cytophagales bacterium]